MLYNDTYPRIITRLEVAASLLDFEESGLGHTEPAQAWRRMLDRALR